jgi:hypothetical protein
VLNGIQEVKNEAEEEEGEGEEGERKEEIRVKKVVEWETLLLL